MTKKVKFAIVGAGVIFPLHANAILKCSDAQLVAVVDIDPIKAKARCDEFNIPSYYTDLQDMLEKEDIDVVTITVPSGLHGDIAIAAANAGKHVLSEKPLEITAEKMTQMIEAAKQNDVKLGCIFQRRKFPPAIAAKRAIESGLLGKVVLGDAYMKYYRSPEYYASAGWRGTWALDGGGALMNQGVHGIDMITWLMGDVESVFARTAAQMHNIEVEDTAVAVVKYKNGAFGVIEGTTSVQPEQATRFEIHGEKGTIIFGDDGIHTWHTAEGDRLPQLPDFKDEAGNALNGHDLLIADMAQAVLDGREPLIPGEEARKAVDLILAIYESSRTGKEVFL